MKQTKKDTHKMAQEKWLKYALAAVYSTKILCGKKVTRVIKGYNRWSIFLTVTSLVRHGNIGCRTESLRFISDLSDRFAIHLNQVGEKSYPSNKWLQLVEHIFNGYLFG